MKRRECFHPTPKLNLACTVHATAKLNLAHSSEFPDWETGVTHNKRYSTGAELWSMVDAPMSTIDARTSTPTSVDVGSSTLRIRKVDVPMSTIDAPM